MKMRALDRVADFAKHADRLSDEDFRIRPILGPDGPDVLVERSAIDIFHYEVLASDHGPAVMDGYNVGMPEPGERLHLSLKPNLFAVAAKRTIPNHLDGDFPVRTPLNRQIDDTLTTSMDLAEDLIPLDEDSGGAASCLPFWIHAGARSGLARQASHLLLGVSD